MRLGDHHIEQDGKMFISLERHEQIRNADQGRGFWSGVALTIFILWLFGELSCAKAAEPPSKPWTALFLYSSGQAITIEDIKHEKTCRELICQKQDGMSCDEKAEAERKRIEQAKKAREEYEAKIAEYRLTHACKIVEDDAYEVVTSANINAGESNLKKVKVPRLHCPLPDGGERVYDKDGKNVASTTFLTSGSGSIFSGPSLTKAVCFQ